MSRVRPWIVGIVILGIAAALGWGVAAKLLRNKPAGVRSTAPSAAPVEITPIVHGTILDRRVFSGALEAAASVTISPKVGGQILSMPVDFADPVERGQVVARLEASELEQAVRYAEADVEVRRAELVEATNALDIAQRELDRTTTLQERGIASESQLDAVRADHLSKSAGVEVAKAQLARAESSLETTRIRLGYTEIRAEWSEGDDRRVVAERFVEIGDTVSSNTPLLRIIELDPIIAVMFITERDYAMISAGQRVTITTDAYPGKRWAGAIDRVAPMFREGSRQARVEIRAPNTEQELKPGMFVRIETVLGAADNATIVPVEALDRRGGRDVVFIVDGDRTTARMTPVRVGIRDHGRVQIIGEGLAGSVVTLGHQLLGESSTVSATVSATVDASEAVDLPEDHSG